MPDSFIHLRTHTAYSLLEGAILPKDLPNLCKNARMPAVGITDSNNLFGSLELSIALAESGIQPIIGCVVDFRSYRSSGICSSINKPEPEQLVLLAQNETGYYNLLQIVSKLYTNPAGGVPPILDYQQISGLTDGIICLTGGLNGGIAQLLLHGHKQQANELLQLLESYFPTRLYIELQRHNLSSEYRVEPLLVEMAMNKNLPLVATNDVYFASKDMYEAHDALLCIAQGRYISEENRRRVTKEHYFKDANAMRELFSDIPEAIENTIQIAKRCSVMAPTRQPILPRFGDMEQEKKMLAEQAESGLEIRLQNHKFYTDNSQQRKEELYREYKERLQYEIDVINQMGFPGYFLIVADFISWAKKQGIPVGPGRGSGAGSIVAWALQITDLDPIRYGLLFERFLNPERVSMPDFDIDFCQERRDEVIRYVQQKYGVDQVAQIITFGKLQARAVLRDVGRVLQLPYGQVDRICKLVPNNPAAPVTLQEAIDSEPGLKTAIAEDEAVQKMADIALKLEGLYRHASTHAAGVVIGDRPLVELLPLYRDLRSDMLIVQYSMKYAEKAGLVKFDFLGLKTLTVLETARKFVKQNHSIDLDLLQLPEGDKATYEMLGRGESCGVFQLESSGMRDTLCKLKPDSIEDIIALVSLYRPGPMDNIPTYIARKHGKEQAEYLHPILEPILQETFGVMIYQEQVMQIAQQLASYSLGEADILRRAMGKKIASEMESQRNLFIERAVKNGVEEPTARAIFDLMAKFASYGFNKSHAAAYALIAYQTAYMKANYPAEFLAASMSYDMHNTDKLAIFVQEANRIGIEILPADINYSFADFRVEKLLDNDKIAADKPAIANQSRNVEICADKQDYRNNKYAIRYALGALKNVGVDAMQSIVAEREKGGKFRDIFDFAARIDAKLLNRRMLENLIRAGAFDSIHKNRRQLFVSIDTIISHSQTISQERESNQTSLFAVGPDTQVIKPDLQSVMDWPPPERLAEEFAAIGFYLAKHPLENYTPQLQKLRVTLAAKLPSKLGAEYSSIRLSGVVTASKFKRSNKGRFAFITMSDHTGNYEISIFEEALLDKSRDILEVGNLLLVTAEGKNTDSGVRLIAKSIDMLDAVLDKEDSHAPLLLTIESERDLQHINANLPKALPAGKKGSIVSFRVKIGADRYAIVRLKDSYDITLPLRQYLHELPLGKS